MLFRKNGFEVTPFPVDFDSSDSCGITILSFVPSAQALARSTAAVENFGVRLAKVIASVKPLVYFDEASFNLWLRNKKRQTQSKKHNDANSVLSEKFEIN